MTELVNIILTTIQFMSQKIMTIQIGGIALGAWIIGILIIIIVVNFVFKHATDTTQVQRNNKRNNNTDE